MIRIGTGFDIHKMAFEKESFLLLGHVKVLCDYRIIANSDGDIVLHSLSNAILSSIGKEDIGHYFKDNESKNLDSRKILTFALEKLIDSGFKINNVSINIKLEQPKLDSYRHEIIQSISSLLNLDTNLIGLTFNSFEGLIKDIIIVDTQLLVED